MEATQNQRVVRPKKRNMENQHHKELDGDKPNTRDSSGSYNRHSGSNFKEIRARHDLMEEISTLQTQLTDSQHQQHLYHCKWAAAERKSEALKAQLEVFRIKSSTAARIIEELQDQLERALSDDAKSYEEEIHELKFELCESRRERINAVSRLILADKIMASLNQKPDEASNKLQQHNVNPAAEPCEEAPTQSTEESQTDLEDPTPGYDKKTTELRQKLPQAQDDLLDQRAKHSEIQKALHCQVEELKAKLCTSEALKEKNEAKVLDLGEEVQKIKASHLAQLEQHQVVKIRMEAELKRALKEKVWLQRTLQQREDELDQRGTIMYTRPDHLKFMMRMKMNKKPKKKRKGLLARLFT